MKKVKVSGTICDKNGNPDYSFNGKIVLKLMEPARILRSKDYETGTCNIPVKITNGVETTVYYTLDVTYDTELIAAFETDVTGGRFEIVMTVPEKFSLSQGGMQDLWREPTTSPGNLVPEASHFSQSPDNRRREARGHGTSSDRNKLCDNSRDEISVSITDDTALSP